MSSFVPLPTPSCRPAQLPDCAVIDCGLRRISNLQPVGHSLVKMCLCDQVRRDFVFCLGCVLRESVE